MGVGGIGSGRVVDHFGDDDEELTPAQAAAAKEAAASEFADKLEDVKGSGARVFGFLDTTRTLDKAIREHGCEDPVSFVMGTLSGVRSKISEYDVEEIVKAAKDYQKITPKEYETLGAFALRFGHKFEDTALRGFVEFLRENAPTSVVASLDKDADLQRFLKD